MSKKPPKSGSGKDNLLTGGRSTETAKVKNNKLKKSSRAWLERQLNDPFVKQAKKEGYRGRAVYKLKEMDQEFNLLQGRKNIVDLGAAPGAWCQYITEIIGHQANIVAVDLKEIEAVDGVTFIQGDFTDDDTLQKILDYIGTNKVDVVLSDMAPNTIGHSKTDHIRIIAILEMALDFSIRNLADGGDFIAKVFQGGAEKDLLDTAKKYFTKVKHFKPQASRKGSPEMFMVARGFRAEKLAEYLEENSYEQYED